MVGTKIQVMHYRGIITEVITHIGDIPFRNALYCVELDLSKKYPYRQSLSKQVPIYPPKNTYKVFREEFIIIE